MSRGLGVFRPRHGRPLRPVDRCEGTICNFPPSSSLPFPNMFPLLRQTALQQVKTTLQPRRCISPTQQALLSRLLSTLAILEQSEGELQHQSLSAVTAAQKLGGSIAGFIAGSNVKPVAEEAAKVNGVEKIIMVENGAYDKVGPTRSHP
jgi:electron transfer flavoprotein alpha subunit